MVCPEPSVRMAIVINPAACFNIARLHLPTHGAKGLHVPVEWTTLTVPCLDHILPCNLVSEPSQHGLQTEQLRTAGNDIYFWHQLVLSILEYCSQSPLKVV
jgi:hypothetical protein